VFTLSTCRLVHTEQFDHRSCRLVACMSRPVVSRTVDRVSQTDITDSDHTHTGRLPAQQPLLRSMLAPALFVRNSGSDWRGTGSVEWRGREGRGGEGQGAVGWTGTTSQIDRSLREGAVLSDARAVRNSAKQTDWVVHACAQYWLNSQTAALRSPAHSVTVPRYTRYGKHASHCSGCVQ